MLMLSAGGKVSEGYLRLLDTDIGEALYHLSIYVKVQSILNPPKSDNEGLGNISFDEVI